MDREKQGKCLIEYIYFLASFLLIWVIFAYQFNFFSPGNLLRIIRKTQILRAEILILHLALYIYLMFIAMSKTKHPANMASLAESEHFVHISALLFVFVSFFRLFFIVLSNNELYFKTFRDLRTFGN